MGILNVTPDSFSDGGRWNDPESARLHAVQLVEQGADILDVGGESTRPGAEPVSEREELGRVIPALNELISCIRKPVSVDTMKASVARAAVGAGASIINDVSGLSDPLMAETAAELDVPIVLMNCHGTPRTFSTDFITGDIVNKVIFSLEHLVDKALAAGVRQHNIILDPGLGFGTTSEQCKALIENCSKFGLGRYPVLVGPSRKRFLTDCYPGLEKDDATAEACVAASGHGADILRIHNVACVAKRF